MHVSFWRHYLCPAFSILLMGMSVPMSGWLKLVLLPPGHITMVLSQETVNRGRYGQTPSTIWEKAYILDDVLKGLVIEQGSSHF